MKTLREKKFADKFLYLFNKYNFGNVDPDQSYINAILKGHIKYLDGKWDTMPTEGGKKRDNAGIVHFNLFKKPWHYDNVMYEEEFWDYAKKTAYYDEIKKIKENYTESDQKKDDDSLEAMLKRCREIVQDEVTFKTVFDSGKEDRL